MTPQKLIVNCLTIAIAAVLTFFVHLFVNSLIAEPIEINDLIYSYVINIILASGAVILLFLFRNRLKDQLGFIFILASMFKFVAFFILFYPQYNLDGVLSRGEFFTFFIPYAVCLILESIVLSKFFNSLDGYK